jgi:hypothetical protein
LKIGSPWWKSGRWRSGCSQRNFQKKKERLSGTVKDLTSLCRRQMIVEKRLLSTKISREEETTVGNHQRFAILLLLPDDREKVAVLSEIVKRGRNV